MNWNSRSIEERNLVNPAFCSLLLFQAALGANKQQKKTREFLSYVELFLILPLILSSDTRKVLPSKVNTSLPIWKERNPLALYVLPERSRLFVKYTREAILYGLTQKLFEIDGFSINPNLEKRLLLNKYRQDSTPEVLACMDKAQFLGKWFAHTGSPETVFALLGVKP